MAESTKKVGRREFLKGAAAAAGVMGVRPGAVRGVSANSKLELGVLGCGGRGGWIGDLFQKNTPTKVVAVHDYFRDRSAGAGRKLGVPASRQHVGLDGYKKLLAGKVDAVAVVSPPCFHPEQVTAAVDAGKHVYIAKPVAVDAHGCAEIVKAGEAGKKANRSVWVDFQTRADPFFIGAAKRVHEGMIGKPVLGHIYYHAGRLGVRTRSKSPTARLRNWVFDIALSGDIIVEQNVHVLDVANWYLNSHPIEAWGTGGRKARVDVGDCWDHFVVTYRYPGDVLVDFSSAQFLNGYHDMCMRVYGTLGTVDSHYGGIVNIRGKKAGWRGGSTGQIYRAGAVQNIKDFHAGIASKKPIHNALESANSTLTGVLGRIAAYGKKLVTWDEMIQANEKMDLKLNLPAGGPDKRD